MIRNIIRKSKCTYSTGMSIPINIIHCIVQFLSFQVSCIFLIQKLKQGTLVLLRNSAKDGRKGDKLVNRWLGPYKVEEHIGKGVYKLKNPSTGRTLKKPLMGTGKCNSSKFILDVVGFQ